MTILFILQAKTITSGPPFPNYLKEQISFHAPILFDGVPNGSHFGSIKTDVKDSYKVVSVCIS